MPETPLHPQPQFARAGWADLCGAWQFAYDDDDRGLQERWVQRAEVFDRTIAVPYPPESRASGVADPSYHPVVWYRRAVAIAPDAPGNRVLLRFGAVDYHAHVWVNGQLVARHAGGHTPICADITSALDPEAAEQVIVVRAEDRPLDLAQPRGKQDWQPRPHAIWYHRTTGIWQPVWLERVPGTYLDEIAWTPDVLRTALGLRVRLSAQPREQLRLRVRLTFGDICLADDTYALDSELLTREIALDLTRHGLQRSDLLWSPRQPNLIDAELTLLRGDVPIDTVSSYAGLRSAEYAHGHFFLNGRPYYLRMVLEQGYWPESHLAAPDAGALRREVELIKALGFNGVRIHQKIEDPRFLYWCDRLGLLVWGEMANAYVFTPEAVERLTREWLAAVRRDYSHPCLVTWVPINESWGVPDLRGDPAQRALVQALYSLTKALDPTRPVIGNDGWEHVAGDVWTIHDYALDGAALLERYGSFEALKRTFEQIQPQHHLLVLPGYEREGMAVLLTEFGGISYAPSDDTQQWYGYGTVRDDAGYLAKYEELVDAILACPSIAGFCYTQLTDTEQESNGLLTALREPKLPVEAIRAINQRISQAVPGEVIANIHAEAALKGKSSTSGSEPGA